MCARKRTVNFGVAMRYWVFVLVLGFSAEGLAQGKHVDGIVFDKETKERMALVNVKNVTKMPGKRLKQTKQNPYLLMNSK